MDALSNLYGWLTGRWTKQDKFGKALLGCIVLLLMGCICGVPLLVIYMMDL